MSNETADNIKYSIIIPTYNEEEVIPELYNRLTSVMESLNESYEIIFIIDGSKDNSFELAKSLHERDDRVKIIKFSRNFGHQIAITAGIEHSAADAVIMMDADLQHPPEIIPRLIEKWKEDYDIVYTVREKTKGASFLKNISAKLFYKIINKIGNINISPNAADFRLIDRKVVEKLKLIKEQSRFMRGLIQWVGYRQAEIKYTADPRYAGKSKYSLARMVRFALDGLLSFSTSPLRLATYFGFTVSFLSFIYAIYAIYIRFFTDRAIAGWTSILVVVLFLGGIQLITIGIIGEYIAKIYHETKRRPLYLISEKIGFGEKNKS